MTEGRSSRSPRRLLLAQTSRQARRLYDGLNQRTGGWLAILKHAYVNFRRHECAVRAAAIAYYTLFASSTSLVSLEVVTVLCTALWVL